MISITVYEFEGKTFDTLKEFYLWVKSNVVHGSIDLDTYFAKSHYATIYLPSNEIKNFEEEYIFDSFEEFDSEFSVYFFDKGTEISEGRIIYDPFWTGQEEALYHFISVIAEAHLKITEKIQYIQKRIYGLYEGKKYIAPCYVLSNSPIEIQHLNGKVEPLPEGYEIKNVHLLNANR